MGNFDENKHPRASDGKFTDGNGGNGNYSQSVNERIKWAEENGIELPLNIDGSVDDLKLQELYEANHTKKKMTPAGKVVKVDMNAEVQKLLSAAETPKERQKIAFRYIMNNLCGEYMATDGRTVSISSVGADKITHRDIEIKLRVSPSLADLLRVGELQGIKDIDHKRFVKFAYYKVSFQIGNERYIGLLNVGIRKDGTSTLYDLNPFNRQ